MNIFRSRNAAAVATGAALMTVLSACGSGAGSDSASTLTIGAIRPASGALAEYGAQFDTGFDLAVKEVNKAGGIDIDGKKVKVAIKYCDSEADPAQAASCGRKLSTEDKVPVVLASLSLEAFPVLAFNATGRSPFVVIAGSASNKLVTQNNPLVARYWFNSYQYMPDFTKLLAELLDEQGDTAKTVAILQSEDEYGQAWNDTFREGWTAAGGTVTDTATFATNSTDVYPQITALLKDKPSVIALPGACPTIIPAVKQARELGFKGRFIFGASCTPGELTKAVSEGAIKGSIFEGTSWDFPSENVDAVKADFKNSTGKNPNIIDAVAYAFAQWAMAASDKAESTTDAQKIRAAMPQVLDDADWNILSLNDLQKNGETSAPIHPRLYKSSDDIVDFTGQK